MDLKLQQYINGKWMDANSGNKRHIINPFNQEIIATVPEGDESDAKVAIAAAREAFDNGGWASTPATERGTIVTRIAELIERDKEELAYLESLDTGKTVEESRGDMDDIAGVFRYYGELADKDGGELI
ncbi:MAG: aldehyde dehydrogenase family protein, partial [Halobacillus sp.]|uniref:aldehyde dehydrogenase family protein n=1 Tax=Halobacillus sp. TaxID=56800 RepID=UPI003BAF07C5